MTRDSNRRTNISSIRTRKKLADALLTVLEDISFDKLTVMDICTAAGLPRATFYNHFLDKYDLLKYMFKTTAATIMPDSLPDIIAERDCLKAVTDTLLRYIEENPELFRRISSAGLNSVFFSEIKNNVKLLLLNFFNARLAKGHSYAADTNLLSEFYANAIVFTVQDRMETVMPADRNEFIDSILQLVVVDES